MEKEAVVGLLNSCTVQVEMAQAKVAGLEEHLETVRREKEERRRRREQGHTA